MQPPVEAALVVRRGVLPQSRPLSRCGAVSGKTYPGRTDRTTARVVEVVMVVVVSGRDMTRLCWRAGAAVKRPKKKGRTRGPAFLDFVVERMGIEPTTSSLRTTRSPS
jgi:hypothetical protein